MLHSQLSLVPEPVVQVEYVPDEWGGSPVPRKPHFTATVGAWCGAGASEEEALACLAEELRRHVERERAADGGLDLFPILPEARQLLTAAAVLDAPTLAARLQGWASPVSLTPSAERRYAANHAA